MPNIAGYLANLGKSVSYSAIDKLKDMTPTTASFVETNAELFKTVYTNVRNYRVAIKRSKEYIQKSKYYEAADQMKQSIFEDLRTGAFYNKKRIDEMNVKAMGSLADYSTEDVELTNNGGSNDDVDMSFLDDDWDDSEVSVIASSVKDSSRKNAELISDTIVRSSEFQADVQKTSTNILYTQNIEAYNKMNSNMEAINSNIGSVIDFLSKTMQTHIENSTKYYEETTKLLQDQTALLRDLKLVMVPPEQKESVNKKKLQFSDLIDAQGTPNLTLYAQNVKQNIKTKMSSGGGGLLDMLDMGGDGNLLLTFAASPLKVITDKIVNELIPNTVENSMNKLDKSLSGFFGGLMSKLVYMAKDEDGSPLKRIIGEIFGVKTKVKTNIDPGNYVKGKIDWDGEAKKALTVVIPTQLSKIISLLSGTPEKVYNYQTGKFQEAYSIKSDLDRSYKSSMNTPFADFKEYVDTLMNSNRIMFNDIEEREKLQKDIQKILERIYSNGGYFDISTKEDNALNYGVNQRNYEIFKQLYKHAPREILMQIPRDTLEARDSYYNEMVRREESGNDIYQHIFNNSGIDEFVKRDSNGKIIKNNIPTIADFSKVLDDKGKNVFYYLQNMYRELQVIRKLDAGDIEGRGPGNGGNPSPSPGPDKPKIKIPEGANTTDKFIFKNGIMYVNPYYGMNPHKDLDINQYSEIKSSSKSKNKYQERLERNEKYKKKLEDIMKREKEKGEQKQRINIDDIDDEELKREFGGFLTSYQIELEAKRQSELANKPKLIDKLLGAKSLNEKYKILNKSVSDVLDAPMRFITRVVDTIDTRLFQIIYGDSKEETGFIQLITNSIKNSFTKLNDWIDEKILKPLKDKFQADSMKEVVINFFKGLGIDIPEIIDGIKDFFTGEDGLFTKIKDSIKDIAKNAWETVKDSFTNVFAPISDKLEERKKRREAEKAKKKKENGGEDENEDSSDSSSSGSNDYYNYNRSKNNKINDAILSILGNAGIKGDDVNSFINNMGGEDYTERVKNFNKTSMDDLFKLISNSNLSVENANKITSAIYDTYVNESNNWYNSKTIADLLIDMNNNNSDFENVYRNVRNNQDIINNSKDKDEIDRLIRNNQDIITNSNITTIDAGLQDLRIFKDNYEKNNKVNEALLKILNNAGLQDDVSSFINKLGGEDNNYFDRLNRFSNISLNEFFNYINKDQNLSDNNKNELIGKIYDIYSSYQGNFFKDKSLADLFIDMDKDPYMNGNANINQDERTNIDNLLKELSVYNEKRKNRLGIINAFNTGIDDNQALDTMFNIDDSQTLGDIFKNGDKKAKIDHKVLSIDEYLKSIKNYKNVIKDLFIDYFGLDELPTEHINPQILENYKSNPNNPEVKKAYYDEIQRIRNVKLGNKNNIDDIFKFLDRNAFSKTNMYSSKSFIDELGEVSIKDFVDNATKILNPDQVRKIDKFIKDAYNSNLENVSVVDFFNQLANGRQINIENSAFNASDEEWAEYQNRNNSTFNNMSDEEWEQYQNRFNQNKDNNGEQIKSFRERLTDRIETAINKTNSILLDIKDSILYLIPGFKKKLYPDDADFTSSIKDLIKPGESQSETDVAKSFTDRIMSAIAGVINEVPRYAGGSDVIDESHMAIVGKNEMVLNQQSVAELYKLAQEQGSNIDKLNITIARANELYHDHNNLVSRDSLNPKPITDEPNIKDEKTMSKFAAQAGKELRNGFDKTKEVLFGKATEEEQQKRWDAAINDITKNISAYSPDMIASGLLGGGISLITGAIGGPLLGAAIGASTGLIKRSEKLQNYLFGEEVNGERTGGLISGNTIKSLKKYLPDMKSFGVVGGLAGLLPFMPLGPVGGLMLGAGIGFAKNTDVVQERLFGDTGLLSKSKQNNLKKVLPRAVGAMIPTLFFGPFGLIGNAALGAGIGLLSMNTKVSEFIFGKQSTTTGKYENGLLPTLRDHVLSPIQSFFKKVTNNFFDWIQDNIYNPVASAFKPITTEISHVFESIANGIKDKFNDMIDKSIGVPIRKLLDSITKHVSSFVRKIFRAVTFPIRTIAKAPFKLLGAIGTHFQKKQVREGRANYMTAAERLAYRKEHNVTGLFGHKGDAAYDMDQTLSQMSDEDIKELYSQMERITSSSKDIKDRKNKLKDEIGEEIGSYFDRYNTVFGLNDVNAKSAMKKINSGDYSDAYRLINKQREARFSADTNAIKMIQKIMNGSNIPLSDKNRSYLYKFAKNNFDEETYKDIEANLKDNNFAAVRDIIKNKSGKDLNNVNALSILQNAMNVNPNSMTKEQRKYIDNYAYKYLGDETYRSIASKLKSNDLSGVYDTIIEKNKKDDAEHRKLVGFIQSRREEYDALNAGDAGAQQINDEAFEMLEKMGFKNFGKTRKGRRKLMNALKSESNLREQRAEEKDPADKINEQLSKETEYQEQQTQKRHSEIVELLKANIKAINALNEYTNEKHMNTVVADMMNDNDPNFIEGLGEDIINSEKEKYGYDDAGFQLKRDAIKHKLASGTLSLKRGSKVVGKGIKKGYIGLSRANSNTIDLIDDVLEFKLSDIAPKVQRHNTRSSNIVKKITGNPLVFDDPKDIDDIKTFLRQNKDNPEVQNAILSAINARQQELSQSKVDEKVKEATNQESEKNETKEDKVDHVREFLEEQAKRQRERESKVDSKTKEATNQTKEETKQTNQLDNIKDVLEQNQKELEIINDNTEHDKDSEINIYDEEGTVRLKRDSKTDSAEPDMKDPDTKRRLDQIEEDRKVNKGILAAVKDQAKSMKDWVKEKLGFDEDDDDNKPGIMSRILSTIGSTIFGSSIVKKVLSGFITGAGVVLSLPLLDRYVIPFIKSIWSNNIKPWLNDHPDLMENMLDTTVSLVGNAIKAAKNIVINNMDSLVKGVVEGFTWIATDFLPALGTSIKNYVAEAIGDAGGILSWTSNKLFGKETSTEEIEEMTNADGTPVTQNEDGSYTRVNELGHTEVYSADGDNVVTYDKSGNFVSNKSTKKGGIINTLKNTYNEIGHLGGMGGENYGESSIWSNLGIKTLQSAFTGKKTLGTIAKVVTVPGKALTWAGQHTTGLKSIVLKGGGKLTSALTAPIQAANGISKGVQEAITTGNGHVILTFFTNFMQKLAENPLIQRLAPTISEKLIKIWSSMDDMLADAIAKSSAKNVGSAAAKCAAKAFNIIYAAYSFISGYHDAKNILGIVDEPSFGAKVISGLYKAVFEFTPISFIMTSEKFMNWILDHFNEWFPNTDLASQRAAAKDIITKYNEENNTNIKTVQEYNEKTGNVSFGTKIKRFFFGDSSKTKEEQDASVGLKTTNDSTKKYNSEHGTSFSDAQVSEIQKMKNSGRYYYASVDNYLEQYNKDKTATEYKKAVEENKKWNYTLFPRDEVEAYVLAGSAGLSDGRGGWYIEPDWLKNKNNSKTEWDNKTNELRSQGIYRDTYDEKQSFVNDKSNKFNRFTINDTAQAALNEKIEANAEASEEVESVTLSDGSILTASADELAQYGEQIYTDKYTQSLVGDDSDKYTQSVQKITNQRTNIASIAETGWKNIKNNIKSLFNETNKNMKIDLSEYGVTTSSSKKSSSSSSKKTSSSSSKKSTTITTYWGPSNNNPLNRFGGPTVSVSKYNKSKKATNDIEKYGIGGPDCKPCYGVGSFNSNKTALEIQSQWEQKLSSNGTSTSGNSSLPSAYINASAARDKAWGNVSDSGVASTQEYKNIIGNNSNSGVDISTAVLPDYADNPEGNRVAQQCWSFYKGQGWNDIQTAGLLGNIEAECSYNPKDIYLGHYGIHQWGGDRFTELQKVASSRGTTWEDLEVN